MPRKEHRTNNVQKELAKAGSSAGQTKIINTFFATSSCGRGVHGGNAASNVSVSSPRIYIPVTILQILKITWAWILQDQM